MLENDLFDVTDILVCKSVCHYGNFSNDTNILLVHLYLTCPSCDLGIKVNDL